MNTANLSGGGRVVLRAGTGRTGLFTVPSILMKHLAFGDLYEASFTDDGILYRYIGKAEANDKTPAWMKQETP